MIYGKYAVHCFDRGVFTSIVLLQILCIIFVQYVQCYRCAVISDEVKFLQL